MRDTIRHDLPGRAIAAYLSAVDAPRNRSQIVNYMRLMHAVPDYCTDSAIKLLVRSRTIVRVARACYRRRWEVV